MPRLASHNRAQVIFEYAIILALVALALGMMRVYLKRGIQAGIKIAADEIGAKGDYRELLPATTTIEESQKRAKTYDWRQTIKGLGGRQTLSVIETSEILYGESIYWSDFEEDED